MEIFGGQKCVEMSVVLINTFLLDLRVCSLLFYVRLKLPVRYTLIVLKSQHTISANKHYFVSQCLIDRLYGFVFFAHLL